MPHDQRLDITPLAREWSRLESRGAATVKDLSHAEQAKKLAQYQGAMKAFSEYMEGQYFGKPIETLTSQELDRGVVKKRKP